MEEEKGSSLEHRETADKGPKILADLQHAKIVDTLHNDEALKVLAAWVGDEDWEPEEEKKLVRRIDRTLLVILTLTYGLQYYDKAMLSQAVSLMMENPTRLDWLTPEVFRLSSAFARIWSLRWASVILFLPPYSTWDSSWVRPLLFCLLNGSLSNEFAVELCLFGEHA